MDAGKCLEDGLGIQLNKNTAEMINREASFTEYPRNHIVLLEGMKPSNLYFILRGIVRGYYIDSQGNDITKCFSSENEFFSSEGLRTAGVSSFTIECLENVRCLQLPYELVHKVIDQDGNLKNLFIRGYLREVEGLERRAKNSALMSARERYADFCREYPYLRDRVELKYIASYIGIRAASLSRIRKEMKNSSGN